MLKVYSVKIPDHLCDEDFDALASLVTPQKRERLARFCFVIDAQRSLLGDVLSRYALSETFGLPNKDLVFDQNPHGKPFVKDRPDMEYNISHAGRYVVCAVSDSPVGIDVEVVGSGDLKIAHRFFAPEEQDYLAGYSGQAKIQAFYRLWTLKESYLKMLGKGLTVPLHSFSVFQEQAAHRAYFWPILANSEAVCHVCSRRNEEPRYRSIDISGLLP